VRVISEGKDNKSKKIDAVETAGYEAAVVSSVTDSTEIYYFHLDHLGTPQVMTDKNGVVVWKANYRPFGEVEIVVGDVGNDFRFPGQYFDDESGLHYNWYRYYDSGVGRYLRADPIGLGGGTNLYAYTLNNPVNLIDTDGLLSDPTGTYTTIYKGILTGVPTIGISGILTLVSGLVLGLPSETAGPEDDMLPSDRPWRKRKRWLVYVRCNIVQDMDGCELPKRMGGKGFAGTFKDAFSHAQMDANSNLGYHGYRDCHLRHCQPVACYENGRRKPCPKSGR